MDPRTTSLPVYVASALTHVAGSQVSLSDLRGPSTEYRFILEGVPAHIDLGEITRSIVNHRGLDSAMISPSDSNKPDLYTARLHAGGRSRRPQETICMSRTNGRVFVDIEPLH